MSGLQHAANRGDSSEEVYIVYLWHMHLGKDRIIGRYTVAQNPATGARLSASMKSTRGKRKAGGQDKENR